MFVVYFVIDVVDGFFVVGDFGVDFCVGYCVLCGFEDFVDYFVVIVVCGFYGFFECCVVMWVEVCEVYVL